MIVRQVTPIPSNGFATTPIDLEGCHVNALRLCHPTLKEKWLEETKLGTPTIATTDEDVASAMNAALELKAGFQSFMISGDYEQKTMNLSKASRMLDWKPQARPIN